ncbi:MAG TPA: M20/M25/M40 family metallo-hydrolase [Gaiellaceae bacterium]|nr:M20/M25/M40 family metallo-hydrolase [Gaiellaceae bacterium]
MSRVFERLDALYAIGGGPGANRPHGSPAEDEAHALAAEWMREAGLEVEVDRHGNLFGHVPGTDPGTGPVWAGSHLDTVPRGGRFDGALGVVAALEAVERARAGSVVVFRGEEVGCVGSRALVAAGGPLPRAFLELHVEQGPVLAERGVPLGVVTGIVGYARGELVVVGRPGHAGTTPMAGREDALVAAAAEVLRVRDAALALPGAVATVGRLDVEPGAVNVIPSRVRLSLDVRAPEAGTLDELIGAIGFVPTQRVEPVLLAGRARDALAASVRTAGVELVELPSGAGHDAGILAAAGVDASMLFVRSLAGGVSHCPEEESSEEDVALAIEVLTAALVRLARYEGSRYSKTPAPDVPA